MRLHAKMQKSVETWAWLESYTWFCGHIMSKYGCLHRGKALFTSFDHSEVCDEAAIRPNSVQRCCLSPFTGNSSPPLPLFLRSPHGRSPWSHLQHLARRPLTTPTAAVTSPLSATSPPPPPPSKMDSTAPRMHWEGPMEPMVSMEIFAPWAWAQRCPSTRFAWRCRERRRGKMKMKMMSAM